MPSHHQGPDRGLTRASGETKKARREEDSGQGGLDVGRDVRPGARNSDGVSPQRMRKRNEVGGSVDAARGADALCEFLPGFLLGGRQRIVVPASRLIVRVRRLASLPVVREFG